MPRQGNSSRDWRRQKRRRPLAARFSSSWGDCTSRRLFLLWPQPRNRGGRTSSRRRQQYRNKTFCTWCSLCLLSLRRRSTGGYTSCLLPQLGRNRWYCTFRRPCRPLPQLHNRGVRISCLPLPLWYSRRWQRRCRPKANSWRKPEERWPSVTSLLSCHIPFKLVRVSEDFRRQETLPTTLPHPSANPL